MDEVIVDKVLGSIEMQKNVHETRAEKTAQFTLIKREEFVESLLEITSAENL